jgi:hypothetical protein
MDMDVLWRTLGIAVAGLALLPAASSAASLHVVFPQSAETTVVQGQSTAFTLEVQAFGATSCDATTAPVRVNSLYSINAAGEVASGQPGDMPITTDVTRGSSENCYIHTPVEVPLTATAAPNTPVGDYTSIIRYGKGGDGGVDLDGPPLTIHVIAAPHELPAPVLAPPAIIVLAERAPAPHPTLGKTLLISVVKDPGQITYAMPGHSPVTLTDPAVVPNGTLIDPGSGVVKVTVARDATSAEDSADVWGTSFRANQVVPNGSKALTTFALTESSVTTGKAAHAARASRKRSLWVNAKGNFKTRGHRASAVVRGTYWVTTETDSTTKVSVNRGLVAVRDFVKKRTVLVSAGHTYTAKPRTHVARRLPAFTGSLRH